MTQQMLDLNRMGFLVEFFESTELEPELIGSSFIEPSNLQSSEGTIKVPIFSSDLNPIEGGRPLDRDYDQDNVSKCQNSIGKLTLKYCVVRPMENADYNLSRTYVSYWSKNWKSLDVGHRYKYSRDANTGQVQYSNGQNLSNSRMVQFLNAI